jgi:hypothetical protein
MTTLKAQQRRVRPNDNPKDTTTTCSVQLRRVGHGEEEEDNGAEPSRALLRVFLLLFLYFYLRMKSGRPSASPFLILLEYNFIF